MSVPNGKLAHEAAVGCGDGGEDAYFIVAACTCSLFDARCLNFHLWICRAGSSGSSVAGLDGSRMGTASLSSLDDARLLPRGVFSFSLS